LQKFPQPLGVNYETDVAVFITLLCSCNV